MTEEDAEIIATKVAAKMALHPPNCQVFSTDEISWIRGCFEFARKTKASVAATVIGFVVIGALSLLVLGMVAVVAGKVKQFLI